MRRKRALEIALGVLLAGGIVYACLGAYAKWEAYRARENAAILLSEVRKLRPGETPFADVERLARLHNHFLMKGSPSRDREVQFFDFWYDNSLLRKLHLAPRVEFTVRLQVGRDRLGVSMLDFTSGLSPAFYAVSLIEFPEDFHPDDPAYKFTHRSGQIMIRLKPSASPEQRAAAYSFNLKCLDKIGGCRDEKELLTGPWQAARDWK